MKPRRVLLINIFALWCLSAGAGYGQAQTTRRDSGSDDQINVTADKLTVSESGAQIEASGNVEIERIPKVDEMRSTAFAPSEPSDSAASSA